MSAMPTLQPWFSPNLDGADFSHVSAVDRDELRQQAAEMLAEPLIAQRLISAGQGGLSLQEGSATDQDLQKWGHSFASAVAILLPPPNDDTPSANRRKRRRYQEQLLDNQTSWPDLATITNTAYLLCVDSRPPELGLPVQLYSNQTPEGLLDFQGFFPLLEQLIHAVSPAAAPTWITAKPGLREALVTMVAETFKNTHDHARQEVSRADVAQSIRGIYSRFYDLPEIERLATTQDPGALTPAERYARNFLPVVVAPGVKPPNRVAIDGLLEISVLDSGPGMAAKWLRRPLAGVSAKEQLDAVIACFEKGRTTSGTQGRGFGLAKVLLKLRELRGFISVRTNDIHVYRQFIQHAGISIDQLPDGTSMPHERLFDWKLGLAPIPSQRQSVRGTVVSFLIPMGRA